jgi:preprotein translocase subunit SecA
LQVVDRKWMDHLDAMDQMRTGIGLVGYGHMDPLVEYKRNALEMFDQMIADIQLDVSHLVMMAKLVERPREREDVHSNRDGSLPQKKAPLRKDPAKRVGRNDPCPCGSGKKYKNCCGDVRKING